MAVVNGRTNGMNLSNPMSKMPIFLVKFTFLQTQIR